MKTLIIFLLGFLGFLSGLGLVIAVGDHDWFVALVYLVLTFIFVAFAISQNDDV